MTVQRIRQKYCKSILLNVGNILLLLLLLYYYKKLIQSMPKRFSAVLQASGLWTKY